MSFSETLASLTRIAGVHGALVVSAEDGLIVADVLMEGVNGPAVAALAASLTGRMWGITRALGQPGPTLLHLGAGSGSLFVATAPEGLLIVAVASPDVNAGALRLALLHAAEHAA